MVDRAIVSSFDDLIRPRQHRRGDREPEHLGGLEVDHEIELRGLLHRQVVHVSSGVPRLYAANVSVRCRLLPRNDLAEHDASLHEISHLVLGHDPEVRA
jgi:hypothetical protein